MPRKFSAVLLLFFTANFCYSQEMDSLRKVISSASMQYVQKKEIILSLIKNSSFKNFEQTIHFTNGAIQFSQKQKDDEFTAELIRSRGSAQYFAGNFDKAAKDFYESIRLLESGRNKKQLAYSYNDLAKLYRKTRDLGLSMENYDKAFLIFKSVNDSAGMQMILNESGVVYEYRQDYEKALDRYQASLNIARSLNDSTGITYALSFMAGVYVIREQYSHAEDLLLQSLVMRKNMQDSFAIALNYTDLGAAMAGAGKYAPAIEYYKNSNRIAQQLKYPELLAANYAALSSIAEKQNNFKDALYYFRQKDLISDSLFHIAKTRHIDDLSIQYQTHKKEQQIQQQKGELFRKNIIITAVCIVFLLTLLLGMSVYRRRKLKQQAALQHQQLAYQQQTYQAVIEAGEKERQRIAQDLHDGVGQMISVAKMNLSALENKLQLSSGNHHSYQKIISLVDDSCREVRNVAHNMMPDALVKNNLATAIHDFVIQLEDKNLKTHVFTEGIDDSMDSNIALILYRIIQECVNNVIKHAEATELNISVVTDNYEISATIEDNGKGFNIDEVRWKEGLGLQSIKARVAILKGTVEFNSMEKKGTVVTINIPVNSKERN